jgi:predicted  nucleic acid-binding Zn-ribbon protein
LKSSRGLSAGYGISSLSHRLRLVRRFTTANTLKREVSNMITTKEDLRDSLYEKCEEAGKLRDALELAKERLVEIERFTKGEWASGSTLEVVDEALNWQGQSDE